MLIPSLKRSMDLASATVCQYNLRELGFCLRMYAQENDGWLPSVQDEQGIAIGRPDRNNAWFARLFPTYLQDPVSLACPKDPYGYRMEFAREDLLSPDAAEYSSYGLNNFIMDAGDGYLAHIDRFQPTRPLDTILVADLGPDKIHFRQGTRSISSGPVRNSSLMQWGDGFDPFTGIPPNPWLTTRHNHGVNVLTLGNSIRKARTQDMLERPMQRHYHNCAAGGCTLCNELQVYHYSFADQNLFWWTGTVPTKQ
jgi:hypothetical protein